MGPMNHVAPSIQLPTSSTSTPVRPRRTLARWLAAATLGLMVSLLSAHADSRLSNLSNRILIGYGQSITAGLTIGGSGSETVLIRGIGPGLKNYGITNPVPDPVMNIYGAGSTLIAGPVNSWKASDAATMSQVGAFSLASGSADAAVVLTLQAGTYTATVASQWGTTGIALIEVYEVSHTGTAQLLNLSSRAKVTTDAGGSLGTGFVITGSSARAVLVRGIGPALNQFGESNPLSNPMLQVMASTGSVIAQNDNWEIPISGGATSTALTAAFTQSGAFSLQQDSLDSAVLVSLPAGNYTAYVTGGAGAAMAEIYDVTGLSAATLAVAASPITGGITTATSSAPASTTTTTTPVVTSTTPTTTTSTPTTTTTITTPTSTSTTTTVTDTNTGSGGANRSTDAIAAGQYIDDTDLHLAPVGANVLRVLSPNLLELTLITTKQPDPAPVGSWNFANNLPSSSKFTVTINGQAVSVSAVGFKRRVLYAPLDTYDLRIQNSLYLQIASPVADNASVVVTNPDSSVWATSMSFTATATPQRYSPAVHVNQEGYVPTFSHLAQVGYYLGDMGELPISATTFNVLNASTGAVVFSGGLQIRQDSGYETTPLPYQKVYVADFSSFQTPGEYQIQVPGMGASLPFLINDGIAMAWTRTYAHGLFTQRSGFNVALPYTRFTHAADHTIPSLVPDTSSKFSFTWTTVAGYASTANSANPTQTAPILTSASNALYPYVRTGSVDTAGGHFDAGDYSKYTINSAQLTHELIFAVDNVPGLKTADNFGIPESGDGIPDVLQEAKWEADYLCKIQDTDGGFYFLTYPMNREYESNVLPENGDQQVVWPKNTSASAASVAALAEAGSSPLMKQYYPQQAAGYLAQATKGWQFLMAAINAHGKAGSYQKLTFYGDDWTHDDELAWAAAAMYAATGDTQYQTQLFAWFPDPSDSSTFRWGWWQMAESWGNAIRDYAFAVPSGRRQTSDMNATYLAKCQSQVVQAGDNAAAYSQASAYGTPFPPATKAVLGGGWYFSLDQAADMAVAYLISPKQSYIDGLVAAMNYEGGSNPVNTCYLEGLGYKRQQQTVSQYAHNSRRVLSPTGDVVGQVTAAFQYMNSYGSTLSNLSYPSDSGNGVTFPYYDRWSDAYNVTTEQITVNQSRSLISSGLLASMTAASKTSWTAPTATISVPSGTVPTNQPVTLSVTVNGQTLDNARIVWEGRDQYPAFGTTYTISPVNNGAQWVECEVEWPDGRRAFAAGTFTANGTTQNWIDDALPANAVTNSDGGDSWNWVSSPTPHSGNLAFKSTGSSEHSVSFTGSTGGMDDDISTIGSQGSMQVNTGDTLYAWVYLPAGSAPTELMMCWFDGSSQEHRAYWGANSIAWGNNNTAGRYSVGALPTTGQWVKISVPASAVGLEGLTVSGMTFAAQGGTVYWDAIGRASAGN